MAGFDPEIFEVTTSYFETYNDCSELINVNDVYTLDSRIFNLMEYSHNAFAEGMDEHLASSDNQFDVIVVNAPPYSSSFPFAGENLNDWIFGDDFQTLRTNVIPLLQY